MKTIKNLNISIREDSNNIEEMKQQRESSILKEGKFEEKISQRLVQNIGSEENPVFLYIATKDEERKDTCLPESAIQFYDSCGELIFTFPWNGATNDQKGCFFKEKENIERNDGKFYNDERRNMVINDLKAVATKEGSIVLNVNSTYDYCEAIGMRDWNLSIHRKSENYKTEFPMGKVSFSEYSEKYKDLKYKSDKWMIAVAEEGDKLLNYGKTNSMVM